VHVGGDPRIERAEGFVEQQDLRFADHGLGNREALLHAARELCRVLVAGVIEADGFEKMLGLLHGRLTRPAEQVAEKSRAFELETE